MIKRGLIWGESTDFMTLLCPRVPYFYFDLSAEKRDVWSHKNYALFVMQYIPFFKVTFIWHFKVYIHLKQWSRMLFPQSLRPWLMYSMNTKTGRWLLWRCRGSILSFQFNSPEQLGEKNYSTLPKTEIPMSMALPEERAPDYSSGSISSP